MAKWLRFMATVVSVFALMLAVRTLVVSIHSVQGDGLEPLFHNGDQLLVNRCSYGLRIAGNGLLPYSRLLRKKVCRGDIVVFTAPLDTPEGLLVARCAAVPGDTIHTVQGPLQVPGLKTCADADYYWLETVNRENPADSRHLGFIHEANIIGRVVRVLYNRNELFTNTHHPSPETHHP